MPLYEPARIKTLDMLYLVLSPGTILSPFQPGNSGHGQPMGDDGWQSWGWNPACNDHSGRDPPMGEGPQAQRGARQQYSKACTGWLTMAHVNPRLALPVGTIR